MKYLLLASLSLSLGSFSVSAATYESNDGGSPGTFNEKASATTTKAGLLNSTGVSTEELNSSPNPAPESKKEVIEDAALTTDPRNPGQVQAQEEENALDYSTAPDKKVVPQNDEITE